MKGIHYRYSAFKSLRLQGSQMSIAKIVASSFLITATVFGEIGQTQTQIEAKYGKSTGVVPNNPPVPGITRSYNFANYLIEVTFVNGICMMETFSRSERMHVDEVSMLLVVFSQGHKWSYQGHQDAERGTKGEELYWARDDLYLIASFSVYYSKVSIATPDFFSSIHY